MGTKYRRNMLLIVLDACRADKVYGDQGLKTANTPNIDKLLSKSTYFSNAFSTTSTTTPSFASILTGLYPPNHGLRSLYGYKLGNSIDTIPEVLHRKGYKTIAEVTGPLLPLLGLNKGFQDYGYRDTNQTYDTSWGNQVLDKIKNRDEKPWFMMLHLWGLHSPIMVPKEYNDSRYGRNRYERALTGLDNFLGKITKILDEKDVVIITSDHGEEIAESISHKYYLRMKYRMEKLLYPEKQDFQLKKMGHGHNIYDNLVRVPLIIKANDVLEDGLRNDSLVSHIDLFPTIMDICQIEAPKLLLDGVSLLETVRGMHDRKYVFIEACGNVIPNKKMWKIGVRTNNYKYIYNRYSENKNEELYDVKNDPKEGRNIVNKERDQVKMLRYLIEKEYNKRVIK